MSHPLPESIAPEIRAAIDLLEQEDHRVVDAEAVTNGTGDWRVELEGPTRLSIACEAGTYFVEGPQAELERAGLWQPLADAGTFARRLRAFANPDAGELPEEPIARGRHPGNPDGKRTTLLIVAASLASTLALNGGYWIVNGTLPTIPDMVRFGIWALIWAGLARGRNGARTAAIIFFTLSAFVILPALGSGAPSMVGFFALAFGITHLISLIVLVRSKPVREHFGLWN